MAKINGKKKGSAFELKVSKILTAWSGQEFHRVPQSGGLRWQVDNNVTGDIVAPADLHFPVSIECKKVEIDWDFARIMEGTSEIWNFWKQACRDGGRLTPKEPWLVFNKNFRKIYIMMRPRAYEILCDNVPEVKELFTAYVKHNTLEGWLLPFESLLEVVTLEDVMKLKLTE